MTRNQQLILDSLLLGVVGALSAQLFMFLLNGAQHFFLGWLAGYRPPGLPEEGGVLIEFFGPHSRWLIPLSTTLGGLISGILVFSVAPEAEGHGTDTAVKAYHRSAGYLRPRVPFIKMIASAITIGSGGSAGREGPTALISAGIGSIYASVFNRSEQDRRTIVLIGMAAGLSAIFRSPIGCAVFAVEVLYRDMEFETGALFYAMLASIVAYVLNVAFVGWQPLFQIPPGLGVSEVSEYFWYILLGIAAGLIAAILPSIFYGFRDQFRRIPVADIFKPAIGGLLLGILALFLPQVLGGGYGWIQEAINGKLSNYLLLALVIGKILSFSFTVSSGGSGGIFAPCLFVGAMLGGFMADLLGQPCASFAVIGLVAVFGASARVPFATLLMVAEMTGGYQLLVPAATALSVSLAIQMTLTRRLTYKSLYEGQVRGRGDSPAHHAEHIKIALNLLRNGEVPSAVSGERLNLLGLLEKGIELDLGDGHKLDIIQLAGNDPCMGDSFRSVCMLKKLGTHENIAMIRQGKIYLPDVEEILREGDKILALVPA
ncbi:MAG: chloride channel protein [Deltaproteobacteria bacterium]|nr:chloride channel protein [Deltaproteobacteria bacterium]